MLTEIFEFDDYRKYLRCHFKALPKQGFGQLSKAAKAIDIQPSLLTGVLQGSKNLTPEQACEFTHYLQLAPLESEYFALLVHLDRAGTERLRQHLEGKLDELRQKSNLLKSRLPPQAELPEQMKAQFYSDWTYSAVRMASSIERLQTPESIATALGVKRQTVMQVLEFLLANGLVEFMNGKYVMGPTSTHIGSGELLVARHHTNWRLKGLENIAKNSDADLHFTSPLSIARTDVPRVRKLLAQAIDQVFDIVDPSPAEQVACLCIDWFALT